MGTAAKQSYYLALSPSRPFEGCFASRPMHTAHAHKNHGKGCSPQGHSPVMAAPDGSSDKVGRVFSHSAQFTSSTLGGDRNSSEVQGSWQQPSRLSPGLREGAEGEETPPSAQGTVQITRKMSFCFCFFLPFPNKALTGTPTSHKIRPCDSSL